MFVFSFICLWFCRHSAGKLPFSVPPVVLLTLFKLLLAVVVSMLMNQWWTYGSGGSSGDTLVESCSNPVPGNCDAYCGEVILVNVNITTDDFTTTVIDGFIVPNRTTTYADYPYCIAEFRGDCAYDYWLLFKLVPILFHVVGFLLQCFAWWFYKDATPQQKQYDIIIAHLYPEVKVVSGIEGEGADMGERFPQRYSAMLGELMEKPLGSVFSFLEMATVVYVWGELLYPPVYCGSVRPLSLYYYPILMSLLDLTKLNFYVSMRHGAARRHGHAVFALLNCETLVTNTWVSSFLAFGFVGWLVRECWRSVCHSFGRIVLPGGSQENAVSWPVKSIDADGSPIAGTALNPIIVRMENGMLVTPVTSGVEE